MVFADEELAMVRVYNVVVNARIHEVFEFFFVVDIEDISELCVFEYHKFGIYPNIILVIGSHCDKQRILLVTRSSLSLFDEDDMTSLVFNKFSPLKSFSRSSSTKIGMCLPLTMLIYWCFY